MGSQEKGEGGIVFVLFVAFIIVLIAGTAMTFRTPKYGIVSNFQATEDIGICLWTVKFTRNDWIGYNTLEFKDSCNAYVLQDTVKLKSIKTIN